MLKVSQTFFISFHSCGRMDLTLVQPVDLADLVKQIRTARIVNWL